MAWYLGIDTSNYTTSAALYQPEQNRIIQEKKLLPVEKGSLGLRQSDAVFAHVKQLSGILQGLMEPVTEPLAGIGVSIRPRDVEGSYMPCFLTGEMAARSIGAALHLPVSVFSHQAGHIAAALFSAGRLDLMKGPFAAFHLSGGTTECLLVQPGTETPFQVALFAKSLDLKAGQAVDRVAAMLGLSFPGGKELEALALQAQKTFRIKPVMRGKDCSLSGIENRCAAMVQQGCPPEETARFCLDSIFAAVEGMTKELLKEYPKIPIIYAGGVMSNSILQKGLADYGYFAEPAFSSDNGAGIAILASAKC